MVFQMLCHQPSLLTEKLRNYCWNCCIPTTEMWSGTNNQMTLIITSVDQEYVKPRWCGPCQSSLGFYTNPLHQIWELNVAEWLLTTNESQIFISGLFYDVTRGQNPSVHQLILLKLFCEKKILLLSLWWNPSRLSSPFHLQVNCCCCNAENSSLSVSHRVFFFFWRTDIH